MHGALPSLSVLDQAAAVVYQAMLPTPQIRWPQLCDAIGTDIWTKHENFAPTGAFKVRGGLVYLEALARRAPAVPGVVCATRGNHGQSIGLAARRFGLGAVVVVPHGNSEDKNAAMRALGVELIVHGEDFQESREHAESLANERGLWLVPSFDPLLVQGVASYSLELLRAQPDLDVLYVPIGLGSGICGAIAAREALGLRTEIVGVVADAAPAYALSFAQRRIVTHPVATAIADGLACRAPDPTALEIMWQHVSRIVRVTDGAIEDAMRLLFATTHSVVEGAGAAALAAAMQDRDRLKGQAVAVVVSGANVDRARYADILAAGAAS